MEKPPIRENEISYRPDVDGLRAIAVLLVILTHLGLPHTQGGFIGVDLFFVISGFLITGNVAKGIATGRFSILGFYERRFRRIFPALFVMLAVASVAAYVVFLPADLLRFARSLVAADLSFSNLFFYWTRSGYFGAHYTDILLHTWSLGVEEQFYLVIPLCMVLASRREGATRAFVLGASALSFVAAAILAMRNRDLAFYMPYTRAWELLSGAMISLGILPRIPHRLARELAAAAGIVLIAVFTAFYRDVIPFPGVSALVPCAAAVLLVLTGEDGTVIGKALSSPPFVFVGLISYSLYLWHWPLIVLLRLGAVRGVREGTLGGALWLILVSLAVATLSWKYVELPFRAGVFKKTSRGWLFASAAAVAAVFCAVGAVLVLSNGAPQRFTPRELALATIPDQQMRDGSCFIEGSFSAYDKTDCLAAGSKKNVLIVGDSHAAALWWGLKEMFPDANFMQTTASSCHPVKKNGGYGHSPCSQMSRFLYEEYLPAHRVDAVVLTERWSSLDDLAALQSTLDWLHRERIPVIIVGPVPEYTVPLPYLLALGEKWNDPGLASRNRVEELHELDRQMQRALEGRDGVLYVSAWSVLCPGGQCQLYAGNHPDMPLLSDVDHLTNEGSRDVVSKMKETGLLNF